MNSAHHVVNSFITAIETKDVELASTFVHDDISYENVPMQPIVGKAAMCATLDAFLSNASEVEWRIDRELALGNTVANERLDRFRIGSGWLELPVAGFFVVDDDGLITLWRDYFDMASYTRQLAALTAAD